MRKSIIGGLAVLAVVVAACQPTKPPPPPGENMDRDVLMLGDSVGFGVGCMLGHNGGDAGQNCPPKPGFSTWNGYLGACAVAEGLIQLYGTFPQENRGLWAVEGNCNAHDSLHYSILWPALVDAVTPDLVVIVTGGWEIVNRWDENNFPTGGLCSQTSILTCPAPDRQMGAADSGLVANAIENYQENLVNAITLIRNRPSQPKVLVLNSPYVAPTGPDPSNVWYEAYPPTQPANWASSNNNTDYASSEFKVDNFNGAIEDLVDGIPDPNVDWFNFWTEFSPMISGDQEFSTSLCEYPNNKNDPASCAGDTFVARLPDAGHLTTAGNNMLGCYLLPKVHQMLGLAVPTPC